MQVWQYCILFWMPNLKIQIGILLCPYLNFSENIIFILKVSICAVLNLIQKEMSWSLLVSFSSQLMTIISPFLARVKWWLVQKTHTYAYMPAPPDCCMTAFSHRLCIHFQCPAYSLDQQRNVHWDLWWLLTTLFLIWLQ